LSGTRFSDKICGLQFTERAVAVHRVQKSFAVLAELITSNPEVMAGRHVFRGTRVPVEVLFDNLADGMSLDEILDEYESLDRADVVKVLELTAGVLAKPRAA
jgi:uncharacterized protein (DUF433 family)